MKILITGGYGFIGSFIAEKFFKENHSIFIIDNLVSGKKENINFKHRSLICNVEDEKCELFFKAHSFDVVIHCAAQTYVQRSIDEPFADTTSNVLGLVNMLNLSKKYGVNQFVFASSAAVYGENLHLPLHEDDVCNPISPYGLNKMMGEIYCRKWDEMYGLSSLIFRFSNVYGPRQHLSKESGVIAQFTHQLLSDQTLVLQGDGEQTRDFIFVSDVAEAIYRGVISGLSGTYNLSSNTQVSINGLIEELSSLHPLKSVQNTESRDGDIRYSQLDNRRLIRDLDWVPKYSLQEGLAKVVEYYRSFSATEDEKPVQSNRSKRLNISFLPVLENAVLFFIFLLGASFLTPIVETVDIWLIYILLSALFFSKTQTILSSMLAIGVQMYEMSTQGRVWTSLFVDNTLLATFTIYLLVGLIVSYVVDRQKIELQATKDDLSSAESKYAFLMSIYMDTLQVKEQLHEQILRTEDSVGKIYYAVKELDSLEPEGVFSGAIHVLERTLKAQKFAIFLVNPKGFMRLAAKSADETFNPGASMEAVPGSMIEQAITRQTIMYNTRLATGDPLFVSPLVQNGETIAVIVCFEADFNRLTLSFHNLIDVVTRLITSSLGRAYDYIQEINNERYFDGTTILKPHYFRRILETKQKAFMEMSIPYVRLKVISTISLSQLQVISSILRTNDYLGYDEDDELYIILSNTRPEEAKLVIERLERKSFTAVLEEEEFSIVS